LKGETILNLLGDTLINQSAYQALDILCPNFDQADMMRHTQEQPVWVHFGGGNLFRCFHAVVAQELLNQKEFHSGIIVAETYDEDVIEKMYLPYNNRFLSVTMKSDGSFEKELVASVAESMFFHASHQEEWNRLTEIFEQSSLQFVTFTITEKGYSLRDSKGNLTAQAQEDILGEGKPQTNMGALAHLLYVRYQAGQYPIALVSTDNFSENGKKLEEAVLTIAKGWVENNQVEEGFLSYLMDDTKVSFPWSMIDRITPNPSEVVAKRLAEEGFQDTEILRTPKFTTIAPFGNTEEAHYLVIEDSFPNGRPALEN